METSERKCFVCDSPLDEENKCTKCKREPNRCQCPRGRLGVELAFNKLENVGREHARTLEERNKGKESAFAGESK